MPNKLTYLALAGVLVTSLSVAAVAAPKGEQGKSAAAENDKKPGQACDKLARGSQAYKDCIAKSAHDGKTPKGAEHGQGKGKPTQ
jgi:hypothetical protein